MAGGYPCCCTPSGGVICGSGLDLTTVTAHYSVAFTDLGGCPDRHGTACTDWNNSATATRIPGVWVDTMTPLTTVYCNFPSAFLDGKNYNVRLVCDFSNFVITIEDTLGPVVATGTFGLPGPVNGTSYTLTPNGGYSPENCTASAASVAFTW